MNKPILYIYVPEINSRVRYIFDLLIGELLGLMYKLTSSQEEYLSHRGPRFCYQSNAMQGELTFGAAYLLFEKGIHEQNIKVDSYENVPVLFPLKKGLFALPFDSFAASFYMISRYEEYLPYKKDDHGRFPAEESLAYRHNFLHRPVVNHYALFLKKILKAAFPALSFDVKPFKYFPTYDVDSAYAYLSKGLIRNIGGYGKSLLEGDFKGIIERSKVLLKIIEDPFDNYDWLQQLHQQYSFNPIYFFLVGDYDEYDKNISININAYQTLIKSLSDKSKVGLHPSYASNQSPEKIDLEIKRLSSVLKREIKRSRQHFLKLNLPATYNRLIEHDIDKDYTMGFAAQPGFRAGIAASFYWYNLDEENKTGLRIYPFAIMDATYIYYKKDLPVNTMGAIKSIIDEVKEVNGLLISLFHNNTLTTNETGQHWRKIYTNLIAHAMSSYHD